jgi:hypothetical protein
MRSTKKIAFLDTECTDLTGEDLVLACYKVVDTEKNEHQWYSFLPGARTGKPLLDVRYVTASKLQKILEDCFAVVMHNAVGFDEKVLTAHIDFTDIDIIDTLVYSRMLCPERRSHSLDAWGKDLGFLKGNFNWDTWDQKWSVELHEYCEQDVNVTERLFWHLLDKMTQLKGNWRASHDFEYRCQQAVDRNVPFTIELTEVKDKQHRIEGMMGEIRDRVYPTLPELPLVKSKLRYPPKVQFKRNGEPSKHAFNYFPNLRKTEGRWAFDHPELKSGCNLPWSKPIVTRERATFGSTAQLKTWLLDNGWQPMNWNTNSEGKRTSPKFQDENKNIDPGLARMGIPWVKDLQEYLTLRHRLSTLQGWEIRHSREPENTKYASGYSVNRLRTVLATPAIACGARTSRMTHKSVANVPRVTSPHGALLRSCLKPQNGCDLVGWDASALEACMEAHEVWDLDRGYAESLVDGTLHDRNAILLGCDRDTAKTFKYAALYGASATRIAKILNCSKSHASILLDDFWSSAWALAEVRDMYKESYRKNKYIEGIDGRKLFPASEHSSLNTRLQSSGAIVMKLAMLIAEETIQKEAKKLNLYASRIIQYHDEEQYEVERSEHTGNNFSHIVGLKGVDSIREAGLKLGILPALTGEYKIGSSWADTH